MANPPSGVSVKDGVVLTAGMSKYLGVLRGALDSSVPLTVTSGERDPSSQAAAMLNKMNAKGEGELYKVYAQNRALIEELLKQPRTVSAWAAFIKAKGQGLSRHLKGGAVDLRTRDLKPGQLDLIRKAVAQTGGRAYTEYDHLHVDLPASYALVSVAERGTGVVQSFGQAHKKKLILGFVAGLALLGWLAWRRRKQERIGRAMLVDRRWDSQREEAA